LEMTKVGLQRKGEDEDDAVAAGQRTVTKIDDGSPLGVAIVLLGGSWLVLGGRDGVGDGGDGIWAVFATASVAAGISRLVRYYYGKRDGEN